MIYNYPAYILMVPKNVYRYVVSVEHYQSGEWRVELGMIVIVSLCIKFSLLLREIITIIYAASACRRRHSAGFRVI